MNRDPSGEMERWFVGEEVKEGSMPVKIRLTRTGKKKQPTYRIVVAESSSPRDGRVIEYLGWYNPRVEPSDIHVDEEKTLKWLKNGAQPTDSVASLLKRVGVMGRFELTKAPKAPAEAEAGA